MVNARRRWLVAGIVALATAVVVPRLGSQSLWTDEAFTILPALEAHDLGDLPTQVRARDTHPPLSHAVLYLTRDILPQSEVGWRLPSFVFVELGLLCLYAAVARAWNRRIALVALIVGQVSPYLSFYAMEARNYALWFLTITASLYCMARWAESLREESPGRTTWTWALLWGLANAAGMWTHMFHVFAIASQGLIAAALAFRARDRRELLRGMLTAIAGWGLATLAFVPWVFELLSRPGGVSGVGWARAPSLLGIAYYPFGLVFGSSLGPDLRALHGEPVGRILADNFLVLAAAATALVVMAFAVVAIVRSGSLDTSRRWESVALVVAPVACVLGPLVYVVATSFPLTPRHLLFAWPAIPVVIAVAAVEHRRLRAPLVGVVALMLLSSANLLWNPRYAKDDERGAVRFAEAHSDAPAVIFGDVAPLYTMHSERLVGRLKRESRHPQFDTAPRDVWLVESRSWQGRSDRDKLDAALSEIGLRYQGAEAEFHGVVLHHWRATDAAAGAAGGRIR